MSSPIANTENVQENGNNTKESSTKNGANFETAIRATGFGKFNYMLIFFIIPSSFAQIFEQVAIAYMIPIAQCDLELTLEDKGLLSAFSYAGMISSGFLFGYICDTYGRKKVIVYGFLGNALFVILGAFSWSFPVILAAKFCSGFIYTGPFSAVASCLSEYHASEYRSIIQIIRGITGALANMGLPAIAWLVLPQNILVSFFGLYDLHAWNLYLLITSSAPIISACLFALIPETPKFLMSQGRNEEAMQIFKKVYRMNTGRDDYPITVLMDELDINIPRKSNANRRQSVKSTRSIHLAAKSMISRMKPLFQYPYNIKLIHVCVNNVALLMGSFALKLWYPTLLTAINDYVSEHNGTSAGMCEMMESLNLESTTDSTECTVNLDNSSVYINSIMVGCTQFVVFIIASTIVNKVGKKTLAIFLTSAAGLSAISLYFATNSTTVVALVSYIVPFTELTGNIVITATLEIFPTDFRTMALSFQLFFGRTGLLVGNILFPYLIKTGCLPSFLFIGLLILSSTFLTALYPNTENKALK